MTKVRSPFFGRAALVLALAVATPLGLRAEEGKQKPQLSEKTGEALQKLKPFMDAKPPNYAEILKVIDGALALAPAGSYDQAFLLDAKAKTFAGSDQYSKAIEPWEQALALSQQHGYFDEKQETDTLLYLAQFIYFDATSIKDKNLQQQQIQRAADYLKRYFARAKKPAAETQMLYAQILYFQATADSGRVNQEKLSEARKIVEDGLLSAIHPKEGFYQLYLAILQQQNETEKSSELLELLLKQYPQKKDFWPVLTGSYLQLAQNTKDEELAKGYQVRAINATERAQALGFMKTPADNYRLVSMYLLAGQFSKGTDLLHAGLRAGTIENSAGNWKLLGSYYLQANRELDAIHALEEADKVFPKDGSFDFQIGEIYRSALDKPAEARPFYKKALEKKQGLEKPYLVYYLLAFVDAIELEQWDEARWAINEAAKYPEFQKDKQMNGLREHIEATIKAREEAKNPTPPEAPPANQPPAKSGNQNTPAKKI